MYTVLKTLSQSQNQEGIKVTTSMNDLARVGGLFLADFKIQLIVWESENL